MENNKPTPAPPSATTPRGRDAMLERLRKRHPDTEYADDDDLYDAIGSDYDEMSGRIGKYEEQDKSLNDMFASDPRAAHFLMAWKDGGDPLMAMVDEYGDDFINALNDPSMREKLAESQKKRLERQAEGDKLQKEYETNIEASKESLRQYQEEHGVDDDKLDEAMSLLLSITNNAIVGKFTPEHIELAMKAVSHDDDVADASEEAYVRGRNSKIDEKLRKRNQSDGIPHLDGSNNAVRQQRRAPSIFDEANGAN